MDLYFVVANIERASGSKYYVLEVFIDVDGTFDNAPPISMIFRGKRPVSAITGWVSSLLNTRPALLNRWAVAHWWAAKVFQVDRETFCHKLKIFLEKIMIYET